MILSEDLPLDLENAIAATERIELVAGDPSTDEGERGQATLEFIRSYAGTLIDLLHELKEKRQEDGLIEGSGGRPYQRTHVEGYSETSAAEALADALNKSVKYFSEAFDVALVLERLLALPGGGHRATIEVRVTPLRHHLTPHVQGMDVQLRRIHDHDYHAGRKFEEEHAAHLVFDHFAASHGAAPVPIPPYFMINVNDAYLLNHMIEKQFLRAGSKIKNPADDGPQPILVRTLKPEPALKPRGR